MNPLQRILSMFTTINLICVILFHSLSPWMQDIVRATTLLILTVVMYTWFTSDVFKVYEELFDSFSSQSDVTKPIKIGTVLVADLLFHVVPLFVVGFPINITSYGIAYIIMFAWYRLWREYLPKIYSPRINTAGGMLTAGIVAVGMMGME